MALCSIIISLLSIILNVCLIIRLIRDEKRDKEKEPTALWAARDEDGSLHLFKKKPIKRPAIKIPSHYFPEVTFKNSPQKVELKLK